MLSRLKCRSCELVAVVLGILARRQEMTEPEDLAGQLLHQASEALGLARTEIGAEHRDELIEIAKQMMDVATEIELSARRQN